MKDWGFQCGKKPMCPHEREHADAMVKGQGVLYVLNVKKGKGVSSALCWHCVEDEGQKHTVTDNAAEKTKKK